MNYLEKLESVKLYESVNFRGKEYRITFIGESGNGRTAFLETFSDNDGELLVCTEKGSRSYRKFADKINIEEGSFLGFEPGKILKSGRDILGEKLLEKGNSLNFKDMKGIFPSKVDGGYIPLGYHTSGRAFTVDFSAKIYMQPEFDVTAKNSVVYSPEEAGAEGGIKPVQSFVNGYVPVLFNFHKGRHRSLESLYFTEQGDADFEYAVWIRNIIIDNSSGNILSVKYINAGACGRGIRLSLSDEVFCDGLVSVLDYRDSFEAGMGSLYAEDRALERVYKGTLMVADDLFNGAQAKYGHRFYGLETHSNFPPNYITSIMVFAMCGKGRKARLLIERLLSDCVDCYGRIIYRQGETQVYSFSGSEIGQLLYVIGRCEKVLTPKDFISEYYSTLELMAGYLLRAIAPCAEVPGAELVRMCAEADTNGRIYDYLQNSLWAVRGLEALCAIGQRLGQNSSVYKEAAEKLRDSIAFVCKKTETDTRFGKVIPFQLQYTPVPLTLSGCEDTAYQVSDEEYNIYISGDKNPRNDFSGYQNYLENTYANYRYYPEILSSCLLDEKYERGIVCMREQIGGECMGMTRLFDGIDDWPAYNYAIYLMEKGYTEKFRMLMYSHILYHGLPDFSVYYEQMRLMPDGRLCVAADSSVPSILLPSFMIMQMYCYETVSGEAIELLKGIPEDMLGKQRLGLDGVYVSCGKVSVMCDGHTVKVNVCGDFTDKEVRLYLPGRDINMYFSRSGILGATENYLIISPENFELIL